MYPIWLKKVRKIEEKSDFEKRSNFFLKSESFYSARMIIHYLFPRQNGLSDESAFVYTAQFMCVYICYARASVLSLSKLQSYSERIRARPEGRERNRFSPTS